MDANRIQYRMAAGKMFLRQGSGYPSADRVISLWVSYSFWQISSTFWALKPKRLAASICNADSENGSGAGSESRLSL